MKLGMKAAELKPINVVAQQIMASTPFTLHPTSESIKKIRLLGKRHKAPQYLRNFRIFRIPIDRRIS